MSDLKERVGYMTGGNANLIPYQGAIICGDGEQTVYLMHPGVPGKVLTTTAFDDTHPEGVEWADASGGGFGGLDRNFLDDNVFAHDSAFEVGGASYANFTDASGATLNWKVGGAGFNSAASAISVNAKLQVYINCASPRSVSGGTLLCEIDLTSATPTHKIEASGTITAPVGSGFINVGVVGGTDDGGPFAGNINAISVSFSA